MYELTVNGKKTAAEKDGSLIDYLRREHGLTSVKNGCGEGACGTCTVLLDGKPARACTLRSSALISGKSRDSFYCGPSCIY